MLAEDLPRASVFLLRVTVAAALTSIALIFVCCLPAGAGLLVALAVVPKAIRLRRPTSHID